MKKLLMIATLLAMMLAMFNIAFADTVQVGTGTATSSYLPIYGNYGYSYSQQIYTQAQINTSGDINKIRFYYVSGTITNSKDWVIYMGHTTKTTFATTTDWEPLANLTEVFNGDVSSLVPLANNWMEITLTTPFPYNNSDNLIVAVDENTSSFASMSWGAFTSGSNTGIYYRSDSTNPDPASPPTASSRTSSINRIQLVFPSTIAPLAPTLVSPANGGTLFTNGKLAWTPTSGGGDATKYDVYFGETSPPPLVSLEQQGTEYTPTLTANTTYYWYVVAKNDIGPSDPSPTWSFTTVSGAAIGDGTVTTLNLPLNPYFGYNYSQTLYLQSEIDISGQRIEKLYYNWNGLMAGTNCKDWTIYMGHTDKTAFASTSDWIPVGNMTQVFSGVVTIPASAGWIEIILNTPFGYNNSDNLVIAVNETTPSYVTNSSAKFYGTSFVAYRGLLARTDGSAYNPASPGSAYELVAGIANIKMQFGEIPTVGLLTVSPDPVACGNAYLGVQKRVEVSLSNTGGAAFDVSSITLDDDTNFQLDGLPGTIPFTINPADPPVTFDVIFAPTAEGALTANLQIGDTRANSSIAVSGTGVAPLVGDVCESAYLATLPLVDYEGTTEGYANDYTSAMFTGLDVGSYANGKDWVTKFTVPAEGWLNVSLADQAGSSSQYMGVFLVNTVPSLASPAEVFAKATGGSNLTITDFDITPGDYYVIVDNWPTPANVYFVLNITFEEYPAVLAPTALTTSNIDGDSADLGWTENNTPAATEWDIIYGIMGFDVETGGTLESGVTTNPYSLTGLNPSTSYDWYARAVIGEDESAWVGPSTFNTSQIPATLPLTEDWESGQGSWTIENGTQTNAWYVGIADPYEGTSSAYVSNDSGVSNAYTISSATSTTHIYRDIAFDADCLEFPLSFQWICVGESSWDRMRVYLVETSVTPVAGMELALASRVGLANYSVKSDWTAETITLPGSLSGTVKRLVFSWKNDGSGGTQPPINLDNISLTAVPLPTEPIFAINPTLKAFGTESVGASASQTFTISNQGGGTMNVQNISLTGDLDQFTLTDLNVYPKEVGEPITVSVAFSPIAEGDFTATLTIDDGIASGKANQTVNITGTGFDATIREIPYIQTWDVPDLVVVWKIQNVNNDAYTWEFVSDGGSNVAKIRWNGSEAMDDWLISPPIILEGGIDYTVSYDYRSSGSYYPESMKVAFGTAQAPGAMTEVIADHNSIASSTYLSNSATFTPSANGTYFLGFHGYSEADMNSLYLDNIRILLPNTQIAQVTATGATATVTVPAITVGGAEISPVVAFAGLSGNPVIEVSASCGPTTDPLTNERLVLNIDGGNLAGVTVNFTHNLGFTPQVLAYQLGNGAPELINNPGDWTDTTASFTIPSGKGPHTVKAIFPKNQEDTLPVTLSSFTAVLTADLHVNIAWIAETETNHAGYNILRSEVKELSTAMMINNGLIDAGSVNGTQISYQYTDAEVYHNARYYYWLEDRSLTGESTYHGPLMVTISAQGDEPEIPVIPVETKLFSAFPNPFNPSTNLRYSMKEAGDVRIEVYNVKGQLLKSFNNNHNQAGYYQVNWDGRDTNGNLAGTGVYFYRMISGKYTSTKKMVLAK